MTLPKEDHFEMMTARKEMLVKYLHKQFYDAVAMIVPEAELEKYCPDAQLPKDMDLEGAAPWVRNAIASLSKAEKVLDSFFAPSEKDHADAVARHDAYIKQVSDYASKHKCTHEEAVEALKQQYLEEQAAAEDTSQPKSSAKPKKQFTREQMEERIKKAVDATREKDAEAWNKKLAAAEAAGRDAGASVLQLKTVREELNKRNEDYATLASMNRRLEGQLNLCKGYLRAQTCTTASALLAELHHGGGPFSPGEQISVGAGSGSPAPIVIGRVVSTGAAAPSSGHEEVG